MLLGEILTVALGALRANKLRSFLTMLGVVIGVGAVIAMVALGRGAQQSVNERIAALGTTLLTVTPGQVFGRGVASGTDRARLTMDDAQALEQRGRYVRAVQPEMSGQAHVHRRGGRGLAARRRARRGRRAEPQRLDPRGARRRGDPHQRDPVRGRRR